MRIIVMSDSHGAEHIVAGIIRSHPEAEVFIHCGDGAEEFLRQAKLLPAAFICVRGNNDFVAQPNDQKTVSLGGKTFFIVHGHRHLAHGNKNTLLYAGLEAKADVVLFGHTHARHLSEAGEKPLLVNPGSVALPRDVDPSYAVLDIENGEVRVRFEEA